MTPLFRGFAFSLSFKNRVTSFIKKDKLFFMVSHASTVALNGIDATGVDVQVQFTPGLAGMQVIGLPTNAVKESKERVRGAFHAMGLRFPSQKITVNLAPADLAKEGSHYDLPMAVALLIAMNILPKDVAQQALFMGELGLDGAVTPVQGCLPAAIYGLGEGCTHIFVPIKNAPEAAWADGLDVFGVKTLTGLLKHFTGEEPIVAAKAGLVHEENTQNTMDFMDIKGQESAKRAAEIAAAGGHNMLMTGPPGSGKSMLARRMPGLLPALSAEEALEVSMIHSVAGTLGAEGLVKNRPFRDPHHSASAIALCGGGLKVKPGEMSLAHRGVLFLDELPEFPRQVLETLRQPLETGAITIARANQHVTYPARFQLVAAMNPCPCGYLGDPKKQCSRAPRCAERYQDRLSGPLLDRFDLHVQVPKVNIKDLDLPSAKEGSKEVGARVTAARNVQHKRYKGLGIYSNTELDGKALEKFAQPDAEGRKLLQTAAERFDLSARAYHRILKVARTIADLADAQNVSRPHIAEALAYRQFSD